MALQILNLSLKYKSNQVEWEKLQAIIKVRCPDTALILLASANERNRDHTIIRTRDSIRDPDLRFFLALLLNLSNREEIYRVLCKRDQLVPPEQQVLRYIQDLSEYQIFNLIFNASAIMILHYLLRDRTLDSLIADLQQVYGDEQIAEQKQQLEDFWRLIADDLILAPLYR
jgi:hypothetical protein